MVEGFLIGELSVRSWSKIMMLAIFCGIAYNVIIVSLGLDLWGVDALQSFTTITESFPASYFPRYWAFVIDLCVTSACFVLYTLWVLMSMYKGEWVPGSFVSWNSLMSLVALLCNGTALVLLLLPGVFSWTSFIVSFFGTVAGMFVLLTNYKFGFFAGWRNSGDNSDSICAAYLGCAAASSCIEGDGYSEPTPMARASGMAMRVLVPGQDEQDAYSDNGDDGDEALLVGSHKVKTTVERGSSFFGGWLCDPRPLLFGWFTVWHAFLFTVYLAEGAAIYLEIAAPLALGTDPNGRPYSDYPDSVKLMSLVMLPITAVLLTLVSYISRSSFGLIACAIMPIAIALGYTELLWFGLGPAIFAGVLWAFCLFKAVSSVN